MGQVEQGLGTKNKYLGLKAISTSSSSFLGTRSRSTGLFPNLSKPLDKQLMHSGVSAWQLATGEPLLTMIEVFFQGQCFPAGWNWDFKLSSCPASQGWAVSARWGCGSPPPHAVLCLCSLGLGHLGHTAPLTSQKLLLDPNQSSRGTFRPERQQRCPGSVLFQA